MTLEQRPPSAAWESVPLADAPASCLWAWYKPAAAPQGVFVRIPPEAFRDPARRQPLTMRLVLHSIGVDPRSVQVWSLYGTPQDAQQGLSPALDFPLPEPSPGVDPTIGVFCQVPMPPATPAPAPAVAAPAAPPSETLERIEATWNACLQIETQVAAVGKQLNGILSRINALNRDLSSEENRYADTQDKREWHDARRWLRDIANRLGRAIKDHYIGITSDAGKRHWFETTYRDYVVPRRQFSGMEQAERDFETYRKTLQTLLNNMVAVHGTAAQDGERRAQVILSRITAKSRSSRSKK